ncbi:hypothetical protein PIB30_105606 [Stylosanthes scabra]|uniref:Uncharacterized protein n=1 Tax=Stylosanthes scabra TaxID=79078 RepID=A0ABU6SYV2_9FABA|nr:hypothetical protein [Stylosanthes scabra]
MTTEQKTASTKLASSKPKTIASESNVPKKASLAIIYNEHDTIIEDPEDRRNPNNTLFPFAIDDKTYCFVSPLLPKDQEENVESFFPTTKGRELLIAKDIYTHNFLKGKSFRNDPKTTFRGVDLFKGWYDRVLPHYVEFWKAHGFFRSHAPFDAWHQGSSLDDRSDVLFLEHDNQLPTPSLWNGWFDTLRFGNNQWFATRWRTPTPWTKTFE